MTTSLAAANSVSTPDAASHDRQDAAPDAQAGRLWHWFTIAGLIIAGDQFSKWWFDNSLHYAERIPVLPVFDFTLLYNPGAAFSFLAGGSGWQRWFFTGVAVAAVSLIVIMLRRHAGQRLFCWSLTLILGGALGNVIDRLIHGHVIDFILLYWQEWYFPAFNIADIAITCGAVLLVLDEFLRWRYSRRTRTP